MLVRRLSEAAVADWHSLRARILMDAGELGSRHMTATWVEVPAGAREKLRTHEEAEQVYVVVRGTGALSVIGDTQSLEVGDLALIPPATDYAIANEGEDELALLSVGSPAVSVDELLAGQSDEVAAEYAEDQY